MSPKTFSFDIPQNKVQEIQFSGKSNTPVIIEKTDKSTIDVQLHGNSSIPSIGTETAKDISLKFFLDNTVGSSITLQQNDGQVILSLVAKTGAILNSVQFSLDSLPDHTGVTEKYLYIDSEGNLTWAEGGESSSPIDLSKQLKKDTDYYGLKIDSSYGLKVSSLDGKSEVIFNQNTLALRAQNSSGVMEDKLYLDPSTRQYIFSGSIENSSISIVNKFHVDTNGNISINGELNIHGTTDIDGVTNIYGAKYLSEKLPNATSAYMQMTTSGLNIANSENKPRINLGYTATNQDFPFLDLASGDNNSSNHGVIKKFSNGIWIGNDEVIQESGQFIPKSGFSGIFFNYDDNKLYVVNNGLMQTVCLD